MVLLLCFAPSAYGLFGKHKICPRCAGTGRDPGTLFLTACPMCGGDGEIGIFMNDEDLEDVVSYLSVVAVGIILIVGVVVGIRSVSQLAPSRSQPIEKETLEKTVFCAYCGTRNTEEAVYCKKCGKKL